MSDWLDLPDGEGAKRRKHRLQKLFPKTPKRQEIVQAMRELTIQQRTWLKALVKNGFSARAARKDLKLHGFKAPQSYTVSRWASNPAYMRARELLADVAYDADAPTKSIILSRLNKIADYCGEEVPEFHQGEPTGREVMRDVGAALKANEMLGKAQKVFGEERDSGREGPALIVQIISKDDPQKVVDVTPGRVIPRNVDPDDVEEADFEGAEDGRA